MANAEGAAADKKNKEPETAKAVAALTWAVSGRVVNLKNEPLEGVEVEIKPTGGASAAQTLTTNFKGEFKAEFKTDANRKKMFRATASASHEGYSDSRELVELDSPKESTPVTLVLRPELEDAHLLSIHNLVSSLMGAQALAAPASGGKGALNDDFILARKELTADQVADAVELLATVVARAPNCVECRTVYALALLDWGSWSGVLKQATEAAHLVVSGNAEARIPQPFILLGVLQSWMNQPKKATFSFLQALDIHPDDALALQELGRACLLERRIDAADRYLQQAITAGASSDAHWVRAETFIEKYQPDKATKELDACLGDRKPKDLPANVRAQWAMMQSHIGLESRGNASSVVHLPLAGLVRTIPDLRGLAEAEDQGQLQPIMRRVGESVRGLFENFQNTTSVEAIRMERLHSDGKLAESKEASCHYLMLSKDSQSTVGIQEFRTDDGGRQWLAGGQNGRFMVTQGFASVALFFHPLNRMESEFRYLGRQTLAGRDTYVIAFAQRPATAKILESFRIDMRSTVVLVQGIAWVDATSYQIVRLRTHLLQPAPEIALDGQITDIRYGEVRLKGVQTSVWLPQKVSVTVDWNNRTFRNSHEYSDFGVFGVSVKQKLGKPKLPAEILESEKQ